MRCIRSPRFPVALLGICSLAGLGAVWAFRRETGAALVWAAGLALTQALSCGLIFLAVRCLYRRPGWLGFALPALTALAAFLALPILGPLSPSWRQTSRCLQGRMAQEVKLNPLERPIYDLRLILGPAAPERLRLALTTGWNGDFPGDGYRQPDPTTTRTFLEAVAALQVPPRPKGHGQVFDQAFAETVAKLRTYIRGADRPDRPTAELEAVVSGRAATFRDLIRFQDRERQALESGRIERNAAAKAEDIRWAIAQRTTGLQGAIDCVTLELTHRMWQRFEHASFGATPADFETWVRHRSERGLDHREYYSTDKDLDILVTFPATPLSALPWNPHPVTRRHGYDDDLRTSDFLPWGVTATLALWLGPDGTPVHTEVLEARQGPPGASPGVPRLRLQGLMQTRAWQAWSEVRFWRFAAPGHRVHCRMSVQVPDTQR